MFTETGDCYTYFPSVQSMCIIKNIIKNAIYLLRLLKLILSTGQRIMKKEEETIFSHDLLETLHFS